MVVCSLADVGPFTSLYALDGKLWECVVGAGRAGDSKEGGESVLHFFDRTR